MTIQQFIIEFNGKFNGHFNEQFNGQLNGQFNGHFHDQFNGQFNRHFHEQFGQINGGTQHRSFITYWQIDWCLSFCLYGSVRLYLLSLDQLCEQRHSNQFKTQRNLVVLSCRYPTMCSNVYLCFWQRPPLSDQFGRSVHRGREEDTHLKGTIQYWHIN